MKVEGYGALYGTELGELFSSAKDVKKSKTGFSGALGDALKALEEAGEGAVRPNQSGTVTRGFSYIVPMLTKSDQDEDGLFSTSSAFAEYADVFEQAGVDAGQYGASGLNSGYAASENAGSAAAKALEAQKAANKRQLEALVKTASPQISLAQAYLEAQAVEVSASAGDAPVKVGLPNAKAQLVRKLMDSFEVETNPKYSVNQKGTGDTYCSSYVADVTSALGTPVPRRIYMDSGAPVTAGSDEEGRIDYLNANKMNDWLNYRGEEFGWQEVTPAEAQYYANRGFTAVTTWKNEGGHGHIQMVSPSLEDTYDSSRGVAISQAGSKLINYGYAEDVYKTSTLQNVQYFVNLN